MFMFLATLPSAVATTPAKGKRCGASGIVCVAPKHPRRAESLHGLRAFGGDMAGNRRITEQTVSYM